MKQENIQPDIPDRPLLVSSAHPNVWTEIGEAQVTHTIFGRAKVRVIRKNDNIHRALWLMLVVVLAAAVWQGWVAFQPGEPLQRADSLSPASEKEQASTSAPQPEIVPASTSRPEAKSEPVSPPQTGIPKQSISLNHAPQQSGLQDNEQKPVKPVAPLSKPVMVQQKPMTTRPKPAAPQPLAGKPQAAPLVTNNNATTNPADKTLPAKLPPVAILELHPLRHPTPCPPQAALP